MSTTVLGKENVLYFSFSFRVLGLIPVGPSAQTQDQGVECIPAPVEHVALPLVQISM